MPKETENPAVEAEDLWPDEWVDWFCLTPQQRWAETQKLWAIYLALGGLLDPEPDTQSHFFDPEAPGASSADGRAGMRVIRRSRV